MGTPDIKAWESLVCSEKCHVVWQEKTVHREDEERKVWMDKGARTWVPIIFYRAEVLELGFISKLLVECWGKKKMLRFLTTELEGAGECSVICFSKYAPNLIQLIFRPWWDTTEGFWTGAEGMERRVAGLGCQMSSWVLGEAGPGQVGGEGKIRMLGCTTWRAGHNLLEFYILHSTWHRTSAY